MDDKGFTGIWIPAEICNDGRLKLIDKALLSMLSGFSGKVWASNGYLAKRLGVGNRTVQRSLARLSELGLVEISIDNGTYRNIGSRVKMTYPHDNMTQGGVKMTPNNKDITKNITKNISSSYSSRSGDDDDGLKTVIAAFQNNIHPVYGDFERDDLIDLYNTYGRDACLEAFKIASKHHARNISYIESVLRNLDKGTQQSSASDTAAMMHFWGEDEDET